MLVHDLGIIDYDKALELQKRACEVVAVDSSKETFFICEHPAVITVGRGLGSRDEVFATTLPVVDVSRGGRATLHLPGQVVAYPILDLKNRGKDLHKYMRSLEEVLINTLADFRIHGERIDGKTGVWVNSKKIASLGIAVKKWVSYHGIALNVNCDLGLFSNLNPCGFKADVMTSVDKELSQGYRKTWRLTPEVLLKNVKKRLIENLSEEFDVL